MKIHKQYLNESIEGTILYEDENTLCILTDCPLYFVVVDYPTHEYYDYPHYNPSYFHVEESQFKYSYVTFDIIRGSADSIVGVLLRNTE
jgi:hypothetical protein